MEDIFETNNRKRPLRERANSTELQAIESSALGRRGLQSVDVSAKDTPAARIAGVSGVGRMPLGIIRSMCAWGLVLSLSAGAPVAGFAETLSEADDSAAEQSADSPNGVDKSTEQSAEIPIEGGNSAVLKSAGNSSEADNFSVVQNADTGKSPVLRSTVTQSEVNHPQPTVHTGDVRVVESGTALDLVLSTEIEAGETAEGDEFFGKIIKDVLVDGQVVIPRGTAIHGVLSTLQEPKRAGRNGYIITRFDQLITPDGRKIPIEGDSTTRDTKGKAAAKVVGRAAGYTAVGGVVGTLIALQFGGLAGAAASHGTTLAGGAAIGGAAGLTIAMLTKGNSVLLHPGAEMRVILSESLKLPTMTMPDEKAQDFSVAGLTIKVAGARIHPHPFGEMTEITLMLDVSNETENAFSTFEIALEDELGNLLFPSALGDEGMLSKIKPNSRLNCDVSFNVYNAKMRHKLVFFKPFSRQPLAKLALTDVILAGGKNKPRGKHVATQARHSH